MCNVLSVSPYYQIMNQLQGKAIDESYTGKPVDHRDIVLSDDDDDDLDKVDTMLHFGGGKFDKANAKERGAYGAGSDPEEEDGEGGEDETQGGTR